MSENLKKSLFPFIGGSYESRSRTYDCSRTVNMYVEVHELGGGKGGEPAVLYSTPGLRKVQEIGTGPIRGMYTVSNAQETYVVSGAEVFRMTSVLGTPLQLVGTLGTGQGPVSMADNGQHLIIVDGNAGYTVELANPSVVPITDVNFYNGATTVTYQGGYFILNVPGTSNFFLSDIDSIDFPPLNESSALSSPDIIIAVLSNNEQLYILGTRTTEVWALTGASASAPFQLIGGRVVNIGCTAPFTLKKLAGTFLWLGANEQGDGVVYSMENDSPTRVSTHAIEFKLQEYGDLSTATAYAYQDSGHYFYVLNIPGSDTTFVYDMTAKMWHERQSRVAGDVGRHIGGYHAFLNGEHLVGDYRNGNIYVYDYDYYFDNGEPITRIRQTPHSTVDLKNVFYKTLQIDVEPGTVISSSSDPNIRITLQMSKDGGFTWGNPIFASIGRMGQYRARARWQRLGYGRDVVFRVSCDVPGKVVLLSAFLDIEPANA